ncbi:MAG TPA: energy transducer TonB [Mucilaginibacter sp.]|nr:energy transducer TonB [Mucilaginibacter sp.]
MKSILIIIAFAAIFSIAQAQQANDTTVYRFCALSLSDYDSPIPKDGPLPPVFDSCPEFPGGYENLKKYIRANTHYSTIFKNNKKAGNVILSAIIEKNGHVSNVRIMRSPDDDLDKEAIRVIKGSPKWKPAIYKGKPVRMLIYCMVKFPPQ